MTADSNINVLSPVDKIGIGNLESTAAYMAEIDELIAAGQDLTPVGEFSDPVVLMLYAVLGELRHIRKAIEQTDPRAP